MTATYHLCSFGFLFFNQKIHLKDPEWDFESGPETCVTLGFGPVVIDVERYEDSLQQV